MRSFILTVLFLLFISARVFYTHERNDIKPFGIPYKMMRIPNPATPAATIKNKEIDTAALMKSDWFNRVTQDIKEKEYNISKDKYHNNYWSPNRQQGLRGFYTANKLTLQPHNDSTETWQLELTLRGIYSGRQALFTPSANPVIEQHGNSIRFHNNHNFIVEYINQPEGIRENFIIQKKPINDAGRLSVELKANRGWFINKVHEKEIHFAKNDKGTLEKKITYNSLKAWDASNRELEASFSVSEDNIKIDINTAGAIYPVTIDPLSTTANWMVEGNIPNINMGTTAFSAGDVNGDGYSDVIVSAWQFVGPGGLPGAAYVFHGSATGLSATPAWTVYTQGSGRIRDVSTAGDLNGDGYSDVLVGNETYDPGGTGGIVYVHLGSTTGLSTMADWTLSLFRANSSFGRPVTCAGDVNGDGFSDILIGSSTYSNGQTNEGAAFLFLSGSPFSPWSVEGNQANANLGLRVGSAGDINGDGLPKPPLPVTVQPGVVGTPAEEP